MKRRMNHVAGRKLLVRDEPDRLKTGNLYTSFLFLIKVSAICRTGARTSNEEALMIRPLEEGPLTRWSTKS